MATIDISGAAIVTGAVVVGVNALVTNFTNWMTTRTLRRLERERAASKVCECRNCPLFEKCKERH